MHLVFTDDMLRNAFESDVWHMALPADAKADISNILDDLAIAFSQTDIERIPFYQIEKVAEHELAIIVKGNTTHNLGCIGCLFDGGNVVVTFQAYAS